jgi:hypothetical protein
MTTAILFSLLLPLAAQAPPREPAKDLFMHFERAPGVEVRYVDYHWKPQLFAEMESGKGSDPLAKRNWIYARLVLEARPMTLETARLPVGNFAVAFWPNLDGKGMSVEVRQVDMREVLPNVNAIGPLPRGETWYKGPAQFETVAEVVDRMKVTVTERNGEVTLTLHYGNRRLPLTLRP